MDVSVSAISGTRKKIALNFTAEEVATALDAAIADYRKSLALPGFRKGKVPTAVVEKRFGAEVVGAATQSILDNAIGDVLKKEHLHPLSGINLDEAGTFKRGENYTCALSFEVLPDIDFPNYDGLSVEQNKVIVTDEEIENILDHLRSEMAEKKDLNEPRLPVDGDFVDVDYAGFDEEGQPVPDVSGEHFSLVLGKKQAIDDFEALIKTILPAEEKDGVVRFPDDYGHEGLAGKTVTMRIKVNSVQTNELPELNDDFAQKMGSESYEKLRESIVEHLTNNKQQSARGEAMQKLLDQILPKEDVELPASLLETRTRRMLAEQMMHMQRTGQEVDPETDLKTREEEMRAKAAESLKTQVFLMALARKENLDVSSQDVEMQIFSSAMRAGQDYQKVSEAYRRSGMTNDIHDRMLADKAMELVYSKATITEIEDTPVTDA